VAIKFTGGKLTSVLQGYFLHIYSRCLCWENAKEHTVVIVFSEAKIPKVYCIFKLYVTAFIWQMPHNCCLNIIYFYDLQVKGSMLFSMYIDLVLFHPCF